MKVGFTGTQIGMTSKQARVVARMLHGFKPEEFHHGDCVGADADAHSIASQIGLKIVIHPPEYESKRAFCDGDEVRKKKPYLERNHDIVDETDILIATPKSTKEELRSGTWATVRHARKCGKKVIIVGP